MKIFIKIVFSLECQHITLYLYYNEYNISAITFTYLVLRIMDFLIKWKNVYIDYRLNRIEIVLCHYR